MYKYRLKRKLKMLICVWNNLFIDESNNKKEREREYKNIKNIKNKKNKMNWKKRK